MANEDQKGMSEKELKEAQQAAALVRGMFKGLKVKDAQKIALAFEKVGINFEKLNKGEASIHTLNKNFEELASAELKVANKSTNNMIEGFEKLYAVQTGTDSALRKSFIRRQLFELHMSKAKREIVEAEEKGMLSMVKARYKKMSLEMAEGMTKVIGKEASGKIMPQLIKLGGIVGAVALAIKLASQAAGIMYQRMANITPALMSAGGGMNMTKEGFKAMGMEATKSLYSLTELKNAWITTDQAMALYKQAQQEHITSLGYMAIKQQGITQVTQATTIMAINHSQTLTLQLAKMSWALTGSAEATQKLTGIAVKWKLSSVDGIKTLGAGISKMSSIARVGTPLIMEMFDNMGEAMLGTGRDVDEMARHFMPLIKNVRAFADAVGMTDREVAEVIKGVNGLTKSANTFTYMALKGPSGKGFTSDYMSAIETSPLAKNIAIINKVKDVTKGNKAYAQMMLQQMGVTAGMGEAMQMKLIDAVTFGKFKPEELLGKSREEQMKQMMEVFGGEGDVMSQIGVEMAVGNNIDEIIAGTLKKMLNVIVEMAAVLVNWKGSDEAKKSLKDLRSSLTATNKVPATASKSTYGAPGG